MKNIFIALFIVTLVQSCTPRKSLYHGYTFNDIEKMDYKISQIKNNHTTKKAVIDIFGSPTVDEGKTFLYIENILVERPFLGQKNIRNRVLQIDFDSNENVKDISFRELLSTDKVIYATEVTRVESGNITTLDKIKGVFRSKK